MSGSIERELGRVIVRILSEIPSLLRVYTVLSALILHGGVLGYLAYSHYTCDGFCLGVALQTQLAQYALLGLVLISAVIVFLDSVLEAYYLRTKAGESDE